MIQKKGIKYKKNSPAINKGAFFLFSQPHNTHTNTTRYKNHTAV